MRSLKCFPKGGWLTLVAIATFSGALNAKSLESANRVKLDVALGTPVVSASGSKAYVRVALTGFEREANAERVPANVAIVLDKSGSMAGDKIRRAREAAILAVQRLAPNDILSIVTYSDTVSVLHPSQPVGSGQEAIRRIKRIRSGGGTALFAGVAKGAAEVRKFLDAEKVNRVILLSDGLANVGPSSPQELGELGSTLGSDGISVTTIGLGLGYNEDLMTQLAGFSDGNHAFVQNAEDLVRVFTYEFGEVLSVVAQDVEIEIECADGIKPLRLLGRPATISGNRVTTRIGQLLSAQEKYVVLEVEVPPGVDGKQQQLADVQVAYLNLDSSRRDSLGDQVNIAYAADKRAVVSNTNASVQVESLKLQANEVSKQAVQLRDAGRVSEARELLSKQAAAFGSVALPPSAAPAQIQALEEAAAEYEADAESFADDQAWKRERKVQRAKQYQKDRQQTYK